MWAALFTHAPLFCVALGCPTVVHSHPLFLLLDRLLLFLPPNSDPCFQSHLASPLFRLPPWLQRKRRERSMWLHLAHRRRWRPLSAAQSYSTWNAWASSV